MQKAFSSFYSVLHDAVDNFPVRYARPLLKFWVFPLGNRARKPKDTLAKDIVQAVLAPGEFRDRLTRNTFISHDENDPQGLLEVTLKKVVESEEADRKLDRAVRNGLVKRYLGNDWFKEAVDKRVLSQAEADMLRETERLVAKSWQSTISIPRNWSRITRRERPRAPARWRPRRSSARPRRCAPQNDPGVQAGLRPAVAFSMAAFKRPSQGHKGRSGYGSRCRQLEELAFPYRP